MMLLSIDHVQVTVPRDREEEVRHFYGTVLGLRELERPRTIPSAVICFALSDATELHVVLEENPFHPPLNDHFALAVDDVDGVKKRLTDHNVGYTGGGRVFVQDPFGNRIEFVSGDGGAGRG